MRNDMVGAQVETDPTSPHDHLSLGHGHESSWRRSRAEVVIVLEACSKRRVRRHTSDSERSLRDLDAVSTRDDNRARQQALCFGPSQQVRSGLIDGS